MSITTTADFLVAQLPNINPPSARFGHTAVPINNSMFIFGGSTGSLLNDLWKYDLNTQTWSQASATGGPSARQEHASTSINNTLFILGGVTSSVRSNQFWQYNTTTQVWTQQANFNFSGISGATCVSLHNYIYVFGGIDNSLSAYNQVYQYNRLTNAWTALSVAGGVPEARQYHTAVIIGTDMLIFGGQASAPFLNDLWKFNILTQQWLQLSDGPPGRIVHTAVAIGSDMFIFGGRGPGSQIYGDTWKYNLPSNTWTQMNISSGPGARQSNAAAAIDGNMLIFGGYNGAKLNDLWDVYLKPVTLQLSDALSPTTVLSGDPYTIYWSLDVTNPPPFPPLFTAQKATGTLSHTIPSSYSGFLTESAPISDTTGIFPITITAKIPYFNFSISDTLYLTVVKEFGFKSFQVTPSPTAPSKAVIVSWEIQESAPLPAYQITILRPDSSTLLNAFYSDVSGSVSDLTPSSAGSYTYTAFAYSNTYSDFSDQATAGLQVTQVRLSDIVIITNPISISEPYQISWTTRIDNNQPNESVLVTVQVPEDEHGATANIFQASYQDGHVGSTTFIAPSALSDNYAITLTVIDQYGSSDIQTVLLTARSLVIDAGPDQTIDYGSSTILGLGLQDSDIIYTWIPSDTLDNPSLLHPVANPLVTTEYTVLAFRSDVNRHKSDSVTITVVAPIAFSDITITPNLTCALTPQPVQISWSITSSLPTPHYTITVRRPDQSLVWQSDYNNVLTGSATDLSPRTAGNIVYNLTVTRNDFGNLSGYGSDTLFTIEPQITAAILPDPTPTEDPYIIQWTATALGGQPSDILRVNITTPIESFVSDCFNNQTYQQIFTAPNYSSDTPVLITASYAPLSDCTVSDLLTLKTKKVAVLAGADRTINYGSSTILGVGLDESDIVYTWSPYDGLNTTDTLRPVASPLSDTTYTVIAFRSDVNRYTSDSVTITVVAPIHIEVSWL